MVSLVIGNAVSSVASVFLAVSNCVRDQRRIYLFQLLETATYCISSVFFASWSGLSTLAISLLRNVLVLTGRLREWHVYVLSLLVIGIGIFVNNRGFCGVLPIIATVELTFANYYAKDTFFVKLSILVNTILWAIYSYLIWDFAAGISQTLISLLGVFSLIKYLKDQTKSVG